MPTKSKFKSGRVKFEFGGQNIKDLASAFNEF